ncbi:pyridine nucleotide-disulfide oxidoreductase [Vineibacter terrae]|uniref:Pyridine nucleotide-disulfide oxidoreductase n=1 Tax=Vineibacter terrae TaxID=2586908 RepID=A0A5C8PPW5_9HYPH|nr:FAD-dependent oxidoreductase [Vineibacter terrae]TXL77183.1 pyridine nucleotide-disulfide oxidoreductase [Vineibacter terrae]
MNESLVIIGAGHAAGQLAASLAQDGFKGAVTLVGEEPHPPYQRPPLSKKFLAGEVTLDRLYVRPPAFYDKSGVRLMLDTRAVAIDRSARTVVIDGGAALPYTTLVLATGSRPRALPLAGNDLDGVLYLRTVQDVQAIRARLAAGRRLVIVGGGYIGLELAAVAARQKLQVTVLEQAPRLMARGVGPIVSGFYERLHREEGVNVITGTAVSGFAGDDRVTHVVCGEARHEADLVVVGVGAAPNVELARDAGLAVEDGIVVDAQCRTADPAVYAVGDCTRRLHPMLDQNLRLESVHNALEQAKIAAASICGRPPPAMETPWFWSDQYDVKLQMAGLSGGHDTAIVRGSPDSGRSFAVFYLRDGVLIAVDAVNRMPEFMASKALIAARARPDPSRLGDERVAMKAFAV